MSCQIATYTCRQRPRVLREQPRLVVSICRFSNQGLDNFHKPGSTRFSGLFQTLDGNSPIVFLPIDWLAFSVAWNLQLNLQAYDSTAEGSMHTLGMRLSGNMSCADWQ